MTFKRTPQTTDVRRVSMMQVIVIVSVLGEGETDDPVREVTEYFDQAGKRLALVDPCIDLASLQRRLQEAEKETAQAKFDFAMSSDAHGAVRKVLDENDVPSAAFIDDNVMNAIRQRDEARKELERLKAKKRK